ncbi:transcriptional regulator [Streptomyces sp. SID3343]|uniref:transcriptional regulator n=1 Tax=Streptomyces sp. SID3343 TaxID=2690260 RepID=UPI00136A49BB|nr:transcriptional regulator [Streptomyces sp. SID3343]MYW01539.1 transcriptional regulator [Streptomyces sp. SID3343]
MTRKTEKRPNTVLRRLREQERHQTRDEFADSMAKAARELGENCACNWRYVAHLEDGTIAMPGPAYRRILERTTGRPFADLGWSAPVVAEPRHEPTSEDHGRTAPDGSPPNAARMLAELLPADEGALTPAQGGSRRQVGAGAVLDLSGRVHGLRLADDFLSGGDLIAPAFRELRQAIRLYRESSHSDEVGRALLAAIGELAQIAGWIASDAGQNAQAEKAYRLGISAARAAGDGTLTGNLIGSLSYHYANTQRPADAVTLAKAAVGTTGAAAPPRARALTHDRAAWAYTKAGNAQEAMKALGAAEAALTEHTDGVDEPGYLYWVNSGELQVMEARAYTELRRPLRAVPLLTDVLSRYDVTHAREMALYLSWLAEAYVHANEPEQAAATAERMITLSADIASERTSERARVVLRNLQTIGEVPEVRQVLHDHGHLLRA